MDACVDNLCKLSGMCIADCVCVCVLSVRLYMQTLFQLVRYSLGMELFLAWGCARNLYLFSLQKTAHVNLKMVKCEGSGMLFSFAECFMQ